MRIDDLNELPDWDDNGFSDDDEGEGWKPNPTLPGMPAKPCINNGIR